jgi:hypothetical protein
LLSYQRLASAGVAAAGAAGIPALSMYSTPYTDGMPAYFPALGADQAPFYTSTVSANITEPTGMLWRLSNVAGWTLKLVQALRGRGGRAMAQAASRLSPRSLGFAPGLIYLGSVVDKVALGQVFLRVLRFSLSISFHHRSPYS